MKKNIIAQFVKEKRKEVGMTQVQFAMFSGVGLAFLRALEQGKTTLKVANVNKVLLMFGCELGPVEIKKRQRNKSILKSAARGDA